VSQRKGAVQTPPLFTEARPTEKGESTMLLECLIKREGPTPVTLDKYDYLFTSRPELTNGDKEAQVCHVNSTDHCDRLISTGNYRLYVHEEKKPAAEPSKKSDCIYTGVGPCPGCFALSGDLHEANCPGFTLTKEKFLAMTNAPQIKSVIKKCTDKNLLDELGRHESTSPTQRPWLIESLGVRLKELEA
jgi:hypothetical protein